MKHFIKILFKFFSELIVKILSLTKITNYLLDKIIFSSVNRKIQIKHKNVKLQIQTPNSLCLWRGKTFSSKEPETLDWIDNFKSDSVFWDIGANIGLYSIYSALKNHETYSFEPSFLNLEYLSKNINLNNLQSKVIIFPIALNDNTKFSELNMSNCEWGGAHSTFDKKTGWDGKEMIISLRYKTLGFAIDRLIEIFYLKQPNYIKIDVDGIENLVLRGGSKTISKSKSILVEVTKNKKNTHFNQVKEILSETGFILKNEFKTSEYSYNQIWNSQLNK